METGTLETGLRAYPFLEGVKEHHIRMIVET